MRCYETYHRTERDQVLPHIHTTVGEMGDRQLINTSLSATIQFLTEMLVVEVTTPTMTRPRDADLFDVPLLTFDAGS